ncbi:Pkinase-domain-containing protein [Schizopora paradoxa]|uniref:non-specific serine/threonine protein kinase n=1 Tax=Schizopora paradoxa TaxID=27342 RepID=A0A0H2R890_9AGAM|nr:Pkinase-domain-containing protein [Schizopora paradoxa]
MPRRGRNADDPRMIGPWKVGRTIGKGASGRVKIARHAKTGKYAAVKIISKTQLANSRRSIHNLAQDAERILLGMEREIVLMKLIDHPNIMQLYDVYETSGELYLILEYIEGGELFDYICERGRLPSAEALDYFQQLMSAVEYCHRFRISHRDLKPENLLLNKQKILKVADFGMAAWQGGTNLLETSCGSPHYAAPEVIIGKPYDGCSADIWSCGVILYALLAGRLPFDAQDVDQLLDKIKVGRYTMPSDIDSRAKDLIARMLDTNVNRRIKLCDIIRHPWFTSSKPRIFCAPPPSLEELARPVTEEGDIDVDILGNLRVLWHGVEDDKIIEGLTNDEETWEKIIYHLLVLYRKKHLENYKQELERAKSLRKSRRTKKSSPKSEGKSQQERPRTPANYYPPRPDPPTPRRATSRPQGRVYRGRDDPPSLPPPPAVNPLRPVDASPYGRRPLPSPVQPQSNAQPSPTSLQPQTSPLAALMSPASPIWEALDMQPPISVINSPEFHDDNVQKYFQQVMDRLNLMQNKQGSAEQSQRLQALLSPNVALTPRPAMDDDPRSPQPNSNIQTKPRKDRPQSLHIPQNTLGLGLVPSPKSPATPSEVGSRTGKENDRPSRLQKKSSLRKRDANDDTSSQPRTPLEGRHVQIVLPPKPDRERTSHPRNATSPISPAFSISEGSSSSFVSSQPKRSWFGNLFNFKPAAFQLLSMRDPDETRDACTKALEMIGVHIAVIATPAQSVVHADGWQGTATLKCHYDDDRDPMGLMAMTKTVAFRVEVHPPSEVQAAMGYTCVVELTQEKGAQSTLKLIYATLRREWNLDNQSSAPVPILSPVAPVSRFAEDIVLYE